MKEIVIIIGAAFLLTGCVDPGMQQYETQRQQDALARQQYITAHPDLDENEKWELQNGIETPAEVESYRVGHAAFLKKQHDGRQKYIDDHPDLSSEIKSAILAGKIVVGMSSDEVLAAWQSDRWTVVDSTDFGDVSISDWKLDDIYVTFKGGMVFSVTYIPQ
jgi:hypothetical protein